MIPVDELRKENKNISDLTDVLTILINNNDLRDNEIFCDLLHKFNDSVQAHLSHEDRSVYSELLHHEDKQINDLAQQFMSNTHELNRLLSRFTKDCRDQKLRAKDSASFIEDTREIFRLVESRLQLENNKLFPAIQAIPA